MYIHLMQFLLDLHILRILLHLLHGIKWMTFNINDTAKLKLLIRLELGFAHQLEQKFRL